MKAKSDMIEMINIATVKFQKIKETMLAQFDVSSDDFDYVLSTLDEAHDFIQDNVEDDDAPLG